MREERNYIIIIILFLSLVSVKFEMFESGYPATHKGDSHLYDGKSAPL